MADKVKEITIHRVNGRDVLFANSKKFAEYQRRVLGTLVAGDKNATRYAMNRWRSYGGVEISINSADLQITTIINDGNDPLDNLDYIQQLLKSFSGFDMAFPGWKKKEEKEEKEEAEAEAEAEEAEEAEEKEAEAVN